MTSNLFKTIAANCTPGQLMDTSGVSDSTLRRWERAGLIEDRSTGRRLSYVVLTVAGYRAA